MRLFISYRRADTEGYVGALGAALKAKTPPVELFIDADKIPTGTDFVRAMLDAVKSCDAVLAVVGPQWRGAVTPAAPARIFADQDPVRVELSAAFSAGVPVFVALLGGATLPQPIHLPADLRDLLDVPATQVSDSHFESDIDELVSRIRSVVQPPDRTPLADARIGMTAPPGAYWGSVELLIDGKSAGFFKPKTDRVSEFVVTPGSHKVQTKNDMWKSNAVTVNAAPGQMPTIMFRWGRWAWKMHLEVIG